MEYTIRTIRQLSVSCKDAGENAGLTQVEAARDFKILQKTVSLLENDPGRCTIESLVKADAVAGEPYCSKSPSMNSFMIASWPVTRCCFRTSSAPGPSCAAILSRMVRCSSLITPMSSPVSVFV